MPSVFLYANIGFNRFSGPFSASIKPSCRAILWVINLKEAISMRATGIVRRIDELGRVVIPKEIRRTLRIREGDPSLKTWMVWERFCGAMNSLDRRCR